MEHHGDVKVAWDGSILIVHAQGPFNDEGMQRAITAVQTVVLAKNLPRWQRLSICDKETLGSPSTLKLVGYINTWCLANGCEKTAIVVCDSVQENVAQILFASSVKVFFNEAEARAWLA